MIRGLHVMVPSSDPRATLAFVRDQLGVPGFEIGAGYWIGELGASNVGFTRPGSGDPAEIAGLSLLCDDLRATVAELKARGVQPTREIESWGYALVTYVKATGDVTIMLFQSRYRKRKPTAKPKSKPKKRR